MQDGKTPFLYACIKGNMNVVKLLMRKEAKVSARDHQGQCPLHFKEVLNNLDLLKLLLDSFRSQEISVDLITKVHGTYTLPVE